MFKYIDSFEQYTDLNYSTVFICKNVQLYTYTFYNDP